MAKIASEGCFGRPFIIAGVVAGAALSGRYLYYNQPRAVVPQQIWTRFVNAALIMFSAIYLANLLRRLIERVMKRYRWERFPCIEIGAAHASLAGGAVFFIEN